jgi:hypothetical protein
MWEFAGVMISGVSLVNDLLSRFRDLSKWTELDLPVDGDWLALAISKGKLEGDNADFVWSREERVATRELRGTARVVIAYNEEKKVKYRICQGRHGDRLVLMKKTAAAEAA